MTRPFTIGTRASRLARSQTGLVTDALSAAFPELTIEVREITTHGDRVTDRPISEAGGTGVFTREIERHLLAGDIDLAVHSLKDLPVEQPAGLVIAATPERADPRDALVCRQAHALAELGEGAVVGTSSPRRTAQLLALRPDLTVRPIRGNVDTRLERLARGDYDAVVTAKAALDRLGRADVVTEVLDVATFLPAPGQGALAVEIREGDLDVMRLAEALNHTPTFVATRAERMLLARLGGGCHLPVGALAECVGSDQLVLRAAVVSPDGRKAVRAEAHGSLQNPVEAVDKCTGELRRRGADALIP